MQDFAMSGVLRLLHLMLPAIVPSFAGHLQRATWQDSLMSNKQHCIF